MSTTFKAWISGCLIAALTFTVTATSVADTTGGRAADVMMPAPAPVAPEFPTRAAAALDFIQQGKYGDAADEAERLCAGAPGSSVAKQIRGALELWVGDTQRAAKDFQAASGITPDEHATHFGLALCALRGAAGASTNSAATDEMNRALSCPDIAPDQTADIAIVQAYHQFVLGDFGAVKNLVTSDPAGQELMAISTAHSDPKGGVGVLSRFLATSTGVPRVQEDAGLRLTFMRKPSMLASAITEPAIQAMLAERIAQPSSAPAVDPHTEPVSGTVAITPSGAVNGAAASVRFIVDDTLMAVVRSSPSRYQWNSRLVLNGPHAIRIEARTDDGGVVYREARTVSVDNAPGATVGTQRSNMDPASYIALEQRLWGLLRPRPSRAVAELVLARLQTKAGDRSDAATHTLIATALDPQLTKMAGAPPRKVGPKPLPTKHADKDIGVWRGSKDRRQVALTFDDGPNARTPSLLDALDSAHAKATFFIIGTRAEVAPDSLRRMAASGYEVENHSYTHPNIAQCLPAMVESEILRTNVIIRSLTGRYPRFFRPPGGNASPTLARLSDKYGLKLAFWTIDGLKSEETASETGLVNYVMKHVHPGSIILLHNGPEVTVNSVPKLVDSLRSHGYEIVTLRELVENTKPKVQ